jgi:hypothetical protein
MNITNKQSASLVFEQDWLRMKDNLKLQIESRGYRVSNEMRNAVMTTLKGQRSGRIYRVPMTKRYYQASAPGEAPAVRTGIYRMSWKPSTYATEMSGELMVISQVDTSYRVGGHVLGELLEKGTSRMAPRPHVDLISEKAEKQAMRIYREPYSL